MVDDVLADVLLGRSDPLGLHPAAFRLDMSLTVAQLDALNELLLLAYRGTPRWERRGRRVLFGLLVQVELSRALVLRG